MDINKEDTFVHGYQLDGAWSFTDINEEDNSRAWISLRRVLSICGYQRCGYWWFGDMKEEASPCVEVAISRIVVE